MEILKLFIIIYLIIYSNLFQFFSVKATRASHVKKYNFFATKTCPRLKKLQAWRDKGCLVVSRNNKRRKVECKLCSSFYLLTKQACRPKAPARPQWWGRSTRRKACQPSLTPPKARVCNRNVILHCPSPAACGDRSRIGRAGHFWYF